MSLTLSEWTELKATYMAHQYIWKRLHIFNRDTYKLGFGIKYADDTDFVLTFVKF